MSFESELSSFTELFDRMAESYFVQGSENSDVNPLLQESKKYSFFSGGKRFRPFLSFLTAKTFNLPFEKIFPIALAIECIHTYSLIHDDLPCMDNDDFRRGKPTNHKKFGDDIALLAGDALLTDAFGILAELKSTEPAQVLAVIREISNAAGSLGMVSGQTWDMKANESTTFENLYQIHRLKTGKLIEVSVFAVALISGLTAEQLKAIKAFGGHLGIAFQIKDDLLDLKDNAQDSKSYPFLIGEDKTVQELNRVSDQAKTALDQLKKLNTQSLKSIIDYNLHRTK